MDQSKVISLVEAICKRPTMYTLNGTFGEVLALLDGYADSQGYGKAGRSSSYFLPFQRWLYRKLGLKMGMFDRWEAYLSLYHDEQTAIDDFARYWHEYVIRVGVPESEFGRR